MNFKTLIAAAVLLVAQFVVATPASAADVTFMMQNNHPNAVEVELYSQSRNYVWPGNGEVFILDDGEAKQMPLSCEEGEQICYGAWIQGDRNTYWGVGPGGRQGCDNCCYTCTGGATETISLDP